MLTFEDFTPITSETPGGQDVEICVFVDSGVLTITPLLVTLTPDSIIGAGGATGECNQLLAVSKYFVFWLPYIEKISTS